MKKMNLTFLVIFSALLFSACNKGEKHDAHEVHWGYEGETAPKFWSELKGEYVACAGTAQSPIDINGGLGDTILNPLKTNYAFTKTSIVNNGHTVQFNVEPGSKLIANETEYELLQFHYHALSEHTLDGKYFPLEVHFVHKANEKDLAVIGVFFEEGEDNQLFTEFLANFPKTEGEFKSEQTIDLSKLLPADLDYFHYDGSLTTPPCSEIVNWYVLKHKLTASAEQIMKFQAILDSNFRPVQELNGREIKVFED